MPPGPPPPLALPDPRIVGCLDGASRDRLHGWVIERTNPFRRLTVGVTPEFGAPIIVQADRYRADVHQTGIGDGYCGFSIPLRRFGGRGLVHIACVDPMAKVGTIDLSSPPMTASAEAATFARDAFLLKVDPLVSRDRIAGWAADGSRPASRRVLRLRVGGRELAQQRATLFREDATKFGGDGFHGFCFSVPPALGGSAVLEDVETGLEFMVRP